MIGFDIDNVLVDFHTPFREFLYKNYNVVKNEKEYFPEIPNISNLETDEIVINFVNDYGKRFKVHDYVKEYLNKFYQLIDEPLIFITARDMRNKYVTDYNIKSCFDGEYKLFHAYDKYKLIEDLELKYFVDDRIENLIDIVNDGIIEKAFLINRPWNLDFSFEHKNLIRVDNLKDVWNFLK